MITHFNYTVANPIDKFILEPHGIGINCKPADRLELRVFGETMSVILELEIIHTTIVVTCESHGAKLELVLNGKIVW